MPDVLDPSEVDALLAAVDAGAVDDSPPDAGGGRKPGAGGGPGGSPAGVITYDFRRPERVSKDQLRALRALHEGFGRNFGAALSGYLRTIVEVAVTSIEQLTYGEFIAPLPTPTCFNLLRAEPLDGQLCLELSPLIVYPIIDRLLGGGSADLFIPQRPLTQIEQRLVDRITERATHHLSEAWGNLAPVKFAVVGYESNPQLVQIVPPSETVVVIAFELKMGNRAGTMSLCIPYGVIEPVAPRLSAQSWATYPKRGDGGESAGRMGGSVGGTAVDVRAVLARTTIRLGELLSLAAGDVITTDKPSAGEVGVQVEGRTKFAGWLGQFRGKRAVRVTRVTGGADAAE